ncbi:MAG: hypothetical protein AAF628_08370 [Planctomycetota bacterium]
MIPENVTEAFATIDKFLRDNATLPGLATSVGELELLASRVERAGWKLAEDAEKPVETPED